MADQLTMTKIVFTRSEGFDDDGELLPCLQARMGVVYFPSVSTSLWEPKRLFVSQIQHTFPNANSCLVAIKKIDAVKSGRLPSIEFSDASGLRKAIANAGSVSFYIARTKGERESYLGPVSLAFYRTCLLAWHSFLSDVCCTRQEVDIEGGPE